VLTTDDLIDAGPNRGNIRAETNRDLSYCRHKGPCASLPQSSEPPRTVPVRRISKSEFPRIKCFAASEAKTQSSPLHGDRLPLSPLLTRPFHCVSRISQTKHGALLFVLLLSRQMCAPCRGCSNSTRAMLVGLVKQPKTQFILFWTYERINHR
jgi:hypothetical protein